MKKLTLLVLGLAFVAVAGAQSWSLTGNAGTNISTNFLGTTDNKPLLFRTNNIYSGEINPNGKVSLGWGAGQGASSNSVAIGQRALSTSTGAANVAVGGYAMYLTTGSDNVAIGLGAMESNTSGNSNTTAGFQTMFDNSTGYDNCAYGLEAMFANTVGNFNTALGFQALLSTTGSQYNTAVGYQAGYSYDLGYNNTILGANCGGSFAGQYNMVAIGQGVVCPDNSTVRIGNGATWSIGGNVGWSSFSDGRYKQDIKENVKGLEFILKLRPITYRLNATGLSAHLKENNGEEWSAQMKTAMADKEKQVLTGFVAQEVEKAASDVGFEFSGVDKPRTSDGLYALRYAEFVVPLVKAIQEQQAMIQTLQARMDTLQQQADVAIVLFSGDGAAAGGDKVVAYPDPVINSMTVSLSTQNAGGGTLSVYDAGGQLIRQMTITVQQGVNTFNLSMPTVAAGYYTLKLDWGTNMHKAISFMKAK